jgi:hypothetical protein
MVQKIGKKEIPKKDDKIEIKKVYKDEKIIKAEKPTIIK